MKPANEIYKALSPAQKRFIRENGMEAKMSIPKWIRFLEPICEFDSRSDALKRKLTKLNIIFMVTLFVVLLVSIFTQFIPGLMIGVPLFLLLIIATSIYRHRYNRRDVNDNVRLVILPLLHYLSLDVGHKQPISLNINFRKPLAKADISDTESKGWFLRPNKSKFYDYEVMRLDAQFLDKTRMQLKVADRIRERTRSNARGKIKTKVKLKRRIMVCLTFSPTLYQLSETGQRSIRASQSERGIKVKHTIKQSTQGVIAEIPMEQVLRQIAGLYSFIEVKERAA